MKEKPLELQRCFVSHLAGLNMTFSDSSCILVALTDCRFTTGIWNKTLHKHYRYSRLLRLFLHFRPETRILKEQVVQKPDCFRLIVSKQHLMEAAVRRCASKKVILKTPQYSQESTCIGVSLKKSCFKFLY